MSQLGCAVPSQMAATQPARQANKLEQVVSGTISVDSAIRHLEAFASGVFGAPVESNPAKAPTPTPEVSLASMLDMLPQMQADFAKRIVAAVAQMNQAIYG